MNLKAKTCIRCYLFENSVYQSFGLLFTNVSIDYEFLLNNEQNNIYTYF